MGMLCNERAREDGEGGIMVFIAAVASSIWCQPAGSGTGTVFRTTHASTGLPSNARTRHLKFQIRLGWIDSSRHVWVWFIVGTHEMTVEGSQLFAYHALDTICGRHPVLASVGRICCCAGGHRATAFRRKEGERGRGCARGGGGGCEDDYPEAEGEKEGGRARGQFRGLFH